MNNYIFDLDGTIINSSNEVLLCFEKAFEKAEYVIDKSRLTADVIGPPLEEIIKLIAPNITKELIQKVMCEFKKIYDYETNDISEYYEGIKEFLNNAKQSGKNLFIATFKPDKPTKRIVQQFKMDMFDDIYTIDKFGKHITKSEMIEDIVQKYNLEKSETVMIGDAPSDVIAAKQAGVTAIGVLWGYGKNKKQLIANADFIVKNTEELAECIKCLEKIGIS